MNLFKNWMMAICFALGTPACLGGGESLNPASAGGTSGTGNEQHACADGETKSCGCADGRNGSQVCNADRDGWTSCECTGPMPTGGTSGSGGSSSGSGGSGNVGNTGNSSGGTGGQQCTPGATSSCDSGEGVMTCGSDGRWEVCVGNSGGTGGDPHSFGGYSGDGGPSVDNCRGLGTKTLTINITSPVEHVYCNGSEMIKDGNLLKDDADATWASEEQSLIWGWQSFGCDAINGDPFHCSVQYCADHAVRYQCYLKNPSNPDDLLHYACANPSEIRSGESFSSSPSAQIVGNLDDGQNCETTD